MKKKSEKVSENKFKAFLREFREFALKDNMISMAIGIIIGGAFTNIVKSLIDNIFNPILGCFNTDGFAGLTITIWKANIKIGAFIMDLINFFIMAFIVFMMLKVIKALTNIGKSKLLKK